MYSYPQIRLYIGGAFFGSEHHSVRAIKNPATQAVLGDIPLATREDLQYALLTAEQGFQQWSCTLPIERSQLLLRVAQLCVERAEHIAYGITLDEGKIFAEALAEVQHSITHIEWLAQECTRIHGQIIPARSADMQHTVRREPIGVCVAFTPWNFPFNQAVRKIVTALGAGCSLIIKGSEYAPSAIMALVQAFHDAGLPAGVLNAIWGEPEQVADTLIQSPIVRKVSFTGSVEAGRTVAAKAGRYIKPITLELGGHSPVIVCADADIEKIVPSLVQFKLRNAGQSCVAPSRFYVHQKVYDHFVDLFVSSMQQAQLGDGLDPQSTLGPVNHQACIDHLQSLLADAVDKGATVLCGGQVDPVLGGNFFQPTVLTAVQPHMRIMNEEPFGPVATITPFDDVPTVVVEANRPAYGLTDYVYTHHYPTIQYMMQQLHAGVVNINHCGSTPPELPFGGVKDSGIGSEGGMSAFDAYLVTKLVTLR